MSKNEKWKTKNEKWKNEYEKWKTKIEKRITKSNNEKRKTKNEKWKTKNEKRKIKKEKQTNFTLLSNIELVDLAWCTPQKWYMLESIVSITCAKWKYFLVNVLKNHSNVLRH